MHCPRKEERGQPRRALPGTLPHSRCDRARQSTAANPRPATWHSRLIAVLESLPWRIDPQKKRRLAPVCCLYQSPPPSSYPVTFLGLSSYDLLFVHDFFISCFSFCFPFFL